MATHPDARCGQCPACQHVETTKRIVLTHSTPAGPGIKQEQADLWNETLERNPCEYPLVFVTYDHHTVEGRIADNVLPGNSTDTVRVETLKYGKINVPKCACSPWEPQRIFETLNYTTIADNLQNMPATWYPGLLKALIKGSQKAKTFTKHGASIIVRRIEDEVPAL